LRGELLPKTALAWRGEGQRGTHCPVGWEEGHSIAQSWGRTDSNGPGPGHGGSGGRSVCLGAKASGGPGLCPPHQSWWGGRCSGRPSPLRTGLHSKLGAVHIRGPGAKGVERDERKHRPAGTGGQAQEHRRCRGAQHQRVRES